MESSMELISSPLVVFGPNRIDTTRAEILVRCLNDKIKEKRFKLQKLIVINEEKKKRNETMKTEKVQLSTKLTNIEQETFVREQLLQTEQSRIKEFQFNIQMLDEHNLAVKRDHINDERKYEHERSALIKKFEETKQKWTEFFKPQYEQSKVYQYLKQSDQIYNSFVERKEQLAEKQKLAYRDYSKRQQEFCNEHNFCTSIILIAKYFISRRDQLKRIAKMKEKLVELENKKIQLIESKTDKIKAWENIYTQPIKRDLMDICLQSNIDQALTLSFTQIQQDTWSQSLTPISTPVKIIPEQISSIHISEKSTLIAANISINSCKTPDLSVESSSSSLPSVINFTTAIVDEDDDIFPTSRRNVATMENTNTYDLHSSTQGFIVLKTPSNSNNCIEQEIPCSNDNHQILTIGSAATDIPMSTASLGELRSIISFQTVAPQNQTRTVTETMLTIQPQVTSNDVQQMLLSFSPNPSSITEEQTQIIDVDSQLVAQQQQRPTFPLPLSIDSTENTNENFTGFNYNFNFDSNTNNNVTDDGRGFTSPINFDSWTNLGSPIITNSNDQFSAFLQQATNDNCDHTTFSFSSFNYADFFFNNSENLNNQEQNEGQKSN